jgi:hypothetical protein
MTENWTPPYQSIGKTIDNGKNGHKILKLAGNVDTDDI